MEVQKLGNRYKMLKFVAELGMIRAMLFDTRGVFRITTCVMQNGWRVLSLDTNYRGASRTNMARVS